MGNMVGIQSEIIAFRERITALDQALAKSNAQVKKVNQLRSMDFHRFEQELAEKDEDMQAIKAHYAQSKKNLLEKAGSLEKHMDTLKTALQESKDKCERLVADYTARLKKEAELRRDLELRNEELVVGKRKEQAALQVIIQKTNADLKLAVKQHEEGLMTIRNTETVMEMMKERVASQKSKILSLTESIKNKISLIDSEKFLNEFMSNNNVSYLEDSYEKAMYTTLLKSVLSVLKRKDE